jgi:branched-subunit amino acid ABC-type transport system permease component
MNWSFVLSNAITIACMYGTLAIGLSLTWSSLGLVNMAMASSSLAGYGVVHRRCAQRAPDGLLGAGILFGALGGLVVCLLAFIPSDKPNFALRGMIATLGSA